MPNVGVRRVSMPPRHAIRLLLLWPPCASNCGHRHLRHCCAHPAMAALVHPGAAGIPNCRHAASRSTANCCCKAASSTAQLLRFAAPCTWCRTGSMQRKTRPSRWRWPCTSAVRTGAQLGRPIGGPCERAQGSIAPLPLFPAARRCAAIADTLGWPVEQIQRAIAQLEVRKALRIN